MAENITLDSIYANEIFKLAKERTDKIFYNSNAQHAEVVHQALMKNAENYVDIFSSSMCTDVSNNKEYLKYMKIFLDGGADRKINILLTDYDDDFGSKPVKELLDKYPDQVSIKRYRGSVLYKGNPVHFTVSDDRAFRLETDIVNRMAFGNFNSETPAKNLKAVFTQMFNSELAENV